jgi:hypothetical protein
MHRPTAQPSWPSSQRETVIPADRTELWDDAEVLRSEACLYSCEVLVLRTASPKNGGLFKKKCFPNLSLAPPRVRTASCLQGHRGGGVKLVLPVLHLESLVFVLRKEASCIEDGDRGWGLETRCQPRFFPPSLLPESLAFSVFYPLPLLIFSLHCFLF